MKRRQIIDPQGHFEHTGGVPAAVRCGVCNAVRLKDKPWAGPCPGPEHAETPALGTAETLRGGLYRGKTKTGG